MNQPETPSRLLHWCGRLALVFLVLVPLAVLAVRVGLVSYSIGLPVFALSCLGSLLILMVLAVASLLPAYKNQRRQALLKSLAAVPPVLLFGALLGSMGDYPPIHDVSTDPDDTPVFTSAGVKLRGEGSNGVEVNPEAIAIQREHYPDLTTIIVPQSSSEAFAQASAVAESLGWVIYNSDPHIGVLEASYSSFWFGFVDDIVIRIRPLDDDTGSEVDLRSVSRVGVGDLGANARRIRAFSQRLRE
ncbi:MAG: DUF1499 domain-containing protein [Gammaproteobacteria bacterium]|nr:DUF1499 domain-containing protein [Gammaproteobacteria bacterium]